MAGLMDSPPSWLFLGIAASIVAAVTLAEGLYPNTIGLLLVAGAAFTIHRFTGGR